MKKNRFTLVEKVSIGAAVAVLGATLFAYLNRQVGLAELVVSFRPILLLLSIVSLLIGVVLRNRVACLLSLIALLLNGLVVASYVPRLANAAQPDDTKLLLFNADKHTLPWVGVEPIIDLLTVEQPDIAVLLEVGVEEASAIVAATRQQFPNQFVHHDADYDGVVIVSKLPIVAQSVKQIGPGRSVLVAQLTSAGGSSFQLLAAHPTNPLFSLDERNEQLGALTEYVAEQAGPVVLAGDLNVTPWSGWFRDLVGDELQDARRGRGLLASWQTPIPLLKIPIDHVLASNSLAINSTRLGTPLYSDHVPLIVTLSLE